MMFTGSTHNRRRGFTLVELLVVVAIIALLIGVLLPALAGARKSSQRVASAGNLRQMAIFKNLYAEDYQDWYPMIAFAGSPATGGVLGKENRRLTPEELAQNQWGLGGYAGFYSLNQKNATKSTAIWKRDYTAVWNGTSWGQSKVGKMRPVMDKYIEGPGSYAALQNPADSSDGGENGGRYPLITPEKILDEYNVSWYNISYFYVAGMKRTDPSLCLLGDETNHVDVGTSGITEFAGVTPYYGTMRRLHPDPKQRGYTDVDNHGDTGGNFAYSDGHVEWIAASRNELGTTETVMPHDRIFDEINTFLRKRGDSMSAVQTVD